MSQKTLHMSQTNHINLEQAGDSSLCRILSLDGGGAKGFYSLGVLKRIEALAQAFTDFLVK
jgi:patatin-like phospholipase/acyl hydrolase